MLRALKVMKDHGFTNVHVLNLPVDLEADWVEKGYPMEPGR